MCKIVYDYYYQTLIFNIKTKMLKIIFYNNLKIGFILKKS